LTETNWNGNFTFCLNGPKLKMAFISR